MRRKPAFFASGLSPNCGFKQTLDVPEKGAVRNVVLGKQDCLVLPPAEILRRFPGQHMLKEQLNGPQTGLQLFRGHSS